MAARAEAADHDRVRCDRRAKRSTDTRSSAAPSGPELKVNVIPLNEDPVNLPLAGAPSDDVVERFAKALVDADVPVTVRRSRGPDASAACGQLKGRTEDPRKRIPEPRT